jgi:hypothetical protein
MHARTRITLHSVDRPLYYDVLRLDVQFIRKSRKAQFNVFFFLVNDPLQTFKI